MVNFFRSSLNEVTKHKIEPLKTIPTSIFDKKTDKPGMVWEIVFNINEAITKTKLNVRSDIAK